MEEIGIVQIASSRQPEFRQLALEQQRTTAAHDESNARPMIGLAGAMFCVTDPSPSLASRAQQILNLSQPPRDLLFAVPADQAFSHLKRLPSAMTDKEFEAIGETCVRALKLVSGIIADQPQTPGWIGTSVRAGWLIYGAARLLGKWRGGTNLPTLAVGVAGLALDTVTVGQKTGALSAPETGFFAPSTLDDIGVALVATEAALGGDDVAMALLGKQLADTEDFYKAAKVFEPVVGACLSGDPAFAGFKLYPFPHSRGSPLGALSSARQATARSVDLDPEGGGRSTGGR